MQTEQRHALSVIEDPTRFRIFALCAQRDFELPALVDLIGKTEGIVGQEIAILLNAGLLKVKREGSRPLYGVGENNTNVRFLTKILELAINHAKTYIEGLHDSVGGEKLNMRSDYENFSQSERQSEELPRAVFVGYIDLDKSIERASTAKNVEEVVDLGVGGGRIINSLLRLD